MGAAEQIKQAVSMDDILNKYGFSVNRAGFMPCPFHHETKGSMKVYKNSFYCFGCGAGTSVIDFVMQLFHINFRQAVIRISNDFGLQLTREKPDPAAIKQRRELDRKRQQKEKIESIVYRFNSQEFKRLLYAKLYKAPKYQGEEWNEEYCEALRALPHLENWFEEYQNQKAR